MINLITTFGLTNIRKCQQCEKTEIEKKLKICTRCKKTFYCSRECQVKNWKIHKKLC